MRHSTAQLAIALCTSMAVSSAPVSPNPISPALVAPRMASDNEVLDSNTDYQKRSALQKRSVGGFAYHNADQNDLDKRTAGDSSNTDGTVQSFSPSDSDDDLSSGSESESDDENNVGAASDTEIQKRSIPEIRTRSPPPSPIETKADVSDFDDNASAASADEYVSGASDDEYSGASDDEKLAASDDEKLAALDDENSAASASPFSAADETSFASKFPKKEVKATSNNQ